MSFGLDYSMGMPPVADMKAAKVAFVCRYVGYFSGYDMNAIATPQGKCLTPGEAKTLLAGGMSPVSNYDWYATRPIDDGFGNRWTTDQAFNAGVWDAQTGNTIHVACGGPATAALYLSGDWDFNTSTDGALVAAYFKGAASVIGLARTGGYGGYWLIKYLFDNGLITYGWQTYAWSGSPTQWDPRAHIQQYSNKMYMSGQEVDYNRSMKSDFGQWTQGGTMVPTGWHDDGTTLTAPNGHKVVHGFRTKVLAGWDPADIPLEEEHQVAHVENYYASDAGAIQTFRYTRLCYTVARGVYKMGIGNELLGCEKALAAMRAAAPVPTIQGIDPAKVSAFLQTAAVKAADLETFITSSGL